MTDVWIDRLWMSVGASLLVIACAGVVWAVIGDRVRGWRASRAEKAARRRCGKCWYDMTGVAGLRCPECGREARDERGLMRSRIRWKSILVSLAILLPAHVTATMPAVRAHGWARLVPMVVLVAWPMDIGALAEGKAKDWAAKELDDRLTSEVLGPVAQRVLANRVQAMLSSQAREEDVVDTLSVGDLVRDFRPQYETALTPGYSPGTRQVSFGPRSSQVWQLAVCIQSTVHPDGWAANGGTEASLVQVGERLVVRAPSAVVAEINSLLSAMREGESWIGIGQFEDTVTFHLQRRGPAVVHCGDITIISLALAHGSVTGRTRYLSEEEDWTRTTERLLEEAVNRDSWERNGGDESSHHVVADRLIIRGPEATRKRCVEILEAVEKGSIERRTVVSGDASLVPLSRLPTEVFDPQYGFFTDQDAADSLRRIVENAVSADAWADNGGDGQIGGFERVLFMNGDAAIRARACVVIDAILETVRDGQPRRCDGCPRRGSSSDDSDRKGPEYVATWKIPGTLRAWGEKTNQEITVENGGITPEEVTARIIASGKAERAYDARGSRDYAFEALNDHLKTLQPQAWEEDTRCFRFHDVLVLWTTRAEMVDHVEAALREAEKGPGTAK